MKNNKRVYMSIGEGRCFNIKVILDDEVVYKGNIESAPKEIKKLRYSKMNVGSINTYFVYSELQ